jgi:hypothetical protein
MAKVLLCEYGGDYLEAHSEGLESRELNPLTTEVQGEIGIDSTVLKDSNGSSRFFKKTTFGTF